MIESVNMHENEPIEKKRNTSSPPRGGPPKKIYRRSFDERLRAVKLHLEEGFTQELVAQEMGVSMAGVNKWVRIYRREGEQGLKDKGNGSPRPQLPGAVRN